MTQQHVCPRDGQTLDWHLKVADRTFSGAPVFFGDRLSCAFIGPIDRQQAIERDKASR